MKKEINRRLAASLIVAFAVYILLSFLVQIFEMQGEVLSSSEQVTRQIARLAAMKDMRDAEESVLWQKIFPLMVVDDGTLLVAVDPATKVVLGSTDEAVEGRTVSELGIAENSYKNWGHGFHTIINGNVYYGVFYKIDGIVYGCFVMLGDIYLQVRISELFRTFFLLAILIILGVALSRCMDRYITRPLAQISDDMQKLSGGNLNVGLNVYTLPELMQMSGFVSQLKENIYELQMRDRQQRELVAVEGERADAANTAKQVFLSRMSHDVRTPVNAIIGMTAIAEEYIDEKNRVLDALEKIDDSGKRLLSMFNEVLDMSMIESEDQVMREEKFCLKDLIDEAVEELRPFTDARGHQMTLSVEKLVHEQVIGNPERVRKIFTNMIENAAKYTPKGGIIKVTVSELPVDIRNIGRYLFVFEDNGIGMTPEDAAHIFEPFERVTGDQRTSEIQGMGLGLSIVKGIVELMNGSIEVESEPGAGSKFSVNIGLKLEKKDIEG